MNRKTVTVTNVGLTYKFMKSRSIKNEILSSVKFWKKRSKKQPFRALNNINFEISEGDVVAVIGNNGAGKSTLLRLLAGIYRPDGDGVIDTHGNNCALLALGAGFNPNLTGVENIYINGLLLGMTRKEIKENIRDIISYSELGDFIDNPVKTYSSGMKSRLSFSIVTKFKPDILLIDEVLGVGDKGFREKSSKTINELITSGKTVIIVSHRMNYLKKMCNKCIWLEKGEIVMYDEIQKVVSEYEKSN